MAPSGTSMFSKLRPGHAKRNASSLASPEPVPSPAAHAHAHNPLPSPSHTTPEYFSSPRFNDNASYTSGSPISPYPPQLPPITRVASKLDKSVSPNSSQYTTSQHSASTGGGSSNMAQDRSMLSPPQRTQGHLSPGYENKPLSARSNAGSTPTSANRPTQNVPQKTEPAPSSETPPQSSSHLAPSVISPSYTNFSKSQTSLLSGISDKLTGSSKGTSTPTAAPSKSKSRLTLRNPMSLLMRRRSGQTLDPLADESLVTQRSPSNVPPMPDNYDPSIRGNIRHDFDAPRLNRGYSYNNASEGGEAQEEITRASPPKIEKEHTPVFREHFDDDTSYEQSQAAIRAEQLVNNDFLARNSVQFPPPERSAPPPPQPKNSPPPPLLPPPPQASPPPRPSFQGFENGSSVLSPVQESENPLDTSTDVTPRKNKSTKSPPPPARSRATSVTDPSFQPAGLPAHLSSRASRFSFQISGGLDSAQEKMLEERHKAKEAEKKQARNSTNSVEDEYDDYGMDDYDDMDGGFDEEIPMLGEEDEFGGGLGDQTLDSGVNAFDFSSLSIQQQNLNDTTSPMNMMQMPVDMNGNPIGFAMSQEMLQQYQMSMMGGQPNQQGMANTQASGWNLTSLAGKPVEPSPVETPGTSEDAAPSDAKQQNFVNLDLDDDMYFDDGLIGDQDDIEPTEFDENVFDDPNGPLYERKVKFAEDELSPTTHQSRVLDALNSETGYEADDDTLPKHFEKSEPSLAHKTSIAQQRPVPSLDNLSAYHSALADAAQRAEAAGRFTRKASVDAGQTSFDVDDQPSPSHSRPSLVPDDGRFSVDTISFPQDDDIYGMSSGYVDDYEYDYSDFDSAMEDDPIIAEANAEALAYDDEGFYGQEFGFYASGNGESPSAWGGFFGPSGLGRTVSGRNAVREPNLTPITERSEYSTRNSFISLNHFRDGQQPMSSPGLAQLARMSPYGFPGPEEEGDMSLDALLKLRKGAFGSSVASLPVSAANSPRNSSPMGMQFVPQTSSPVGNRMREQPSESLESSYSSNNISSDYQNDDQDNEEDDEGLMDAVNGAYESGRSSEDDYDGDERPESPTLTASDYNSLSSPTGYGVGNEAPLLPPISELYAQHNMMSLAMSPSGMSATSPSNISLPVSPFPMPLTSPYLPQHQNRPPNPPSIDTSLSSPSAPTVSTSGGPRRQSMGLSPISNSSPITPNGGSGGGWNRGHSRKGSAADSVTYVREHDEAGEGRWVLERRRTAESGELELIGREIVEGGRI
ncbi:unnamed protein product [Alternaria sp. RS040]